MSTPVISAMGYIAIRTTRLEEAVYDATTLLGLRVTRREPGAVYLAAADVHHEMVYLDSDVDAIDHLGYVAADEAALAEVRRRVDALGLPIVAETPLTPEIEQGFAFVGPEDFVIAVYLGMTANTRTEPTHGPDRFGHINIHPRDVEAMKAFYVDVLDFRISDVIGDDFAYFLRCNPDHHGVALIAGRGTLHHHAWQTQSVADLGRLGDRLDVVGRRLIWGPVRHGAGHNIAAYFVEAPGDVIELYTDLEQIYDDSRPPIVWKGDDRRWFNKWGVYNGEDFRSHGIPAAPLDRISSHKEEEL